MIPFLPAANILVRVGFVIAERVLYLPSIGFCLLSAQLFIIAYRSCNIQVGIEPIGGKWMSENPSLMIAIFQHQLKVWFSVICLLYLSKSILRSGDWLTEKSLFMSGVQVCPNNAKVRFTQITFV